MSIIVVSNYWPRANGVHQAWFEVEQVRALVELGFQVEVVIHRVPWKTNGDILRQHDLELDASKVTLHELSLLRLPEPIAKTEWGAAVNIKIAGRSMRSWITNWRDVRGIIIHGERNIGISSHIWNRDVRKPVAMIIHGSDPALEGLSGHFLEQRVGKLASSSLKSIILVGNRLRSYARHIGYDQSIVKVVPNGIRLPLSGERCPEIGRGPVRLLSVGRLINVKGIDFLLRALAQVSSEAPSLNWDLTILGEGPERALLTQLTSELGLCGKVTFQGAVEHKEVMRFMRASEIFVLPSWNEAFGIVYLEAMANGSTAIGCEENGAADIITHAKDGLLVPPKNVELLKVALIELISSPEKRAHYSANAAETVKKFSWRESTRRILETLEIDH